MADAVNILSHAETANQAPVFAPYSKVIIHAGLSPDGESEIVYTAGNDTGRTLELNNEWGTQAMANNILARIKGFQYKPFDASNAMVDPSVELGDGITVKGIYSGIFVQATRFNQLMASDVSAPVDEEIEHEYGFESQTNRAFTRMVAQTKSGIHQNAEEISVQVESIRYDAFDTENTQSLASRITVNANGITQEVRDRQQAVSDEADAREQAIQDEADARDSAIGTAVTEMNSTLTQTAKQIRADVVAKRGNSQTTSFAWELLEDSFTLYSNNKEVFKANSNGITVTGSGKFSGEVSATSGAIGGFTLANGVLYTNGKTGIDTDLNGVHISASGISLGKQGVFKVTNQGAITAKSGTIGGFTLTNNAIYNGKKSLNDNVDGVYIGTGGIALGKGDKFQVNSSGAVTASNLTIKGGSININNGAFVVDVNGNLTANNGSFGGNVYAKNIKYYDGTSGSANYGTLDGAAITAKTIKGSGKGTVGQLDPLSVGGGDIAYGSISGGAAGSSYSHIKQNTLTDLNVVPNTYSGGGLSTKSLTSEIGTSLGLADLFGNAKTTSSRLDYFKSQQLVATSSVYSPKFICADTSGGTNEVELNGHYHALTESQGRIVLSSPHNDSKIERHSFKIADTQYFKDFVEALNVTLTRTYPEDGINYYPYYNSQTLGKIIEYKIQYSIKDGEGKIVGSGSQVMNVPADKAYEAGKNDATVSQIVVNREYQGDQGWWYDQQGYSNHYHVNVKVKALNGDGAKCGQDTVAVDVQSMVDTAWAYGRSQNAPVAVYKETNEYGEWDGKTVFVQTGWTTYTGFTLR